MVTQNKTILVATGCRSEWGVLDPLVAALSERFPTSVLAVGSHLSHEFGHTVDQILYPVHKVHTMLSADSPAGVCKSQGVGLISLPETLTTLRPALVVVEGDRSEMLPVALTAYNLGIPVAHISGGDVTKGSKDDGYRDCITRLSTLHFTDTMEAAIRVTYILGLSMSEGRVFNVGSLSAHGLAPSTARREGVLVSLHPCADLPLGIVTSTLDAIRVVTAEGPCYITAPAPDANGAALRDRLCTYSQEHMRTTFVGTNTTRLGFLTLLGKVKIAIGNSSALVVEAPLLHTPSVLLGDRQKGRPLAKSVVPCPAPVTVDHLKTAIAKATTNVGVGPFPYSDEGTIPRIAAIIKGFLSC